MGDFVARYGWLAWAPVILFVSVAPAGLDLRLHAPRRLVAVGRARTLLRVRPLRRARRAGARAGGDRLDRAAARGGRRDRLRPGDRADPVADLLSLARTRATSRSTWSASFARLRYCGACGGAVAPPRRRRAATPLKSRQRRRRTVISLNEAVDLVLAAVRPLAARAGAAARGAGPRRRRRDRLARGGAVVRQLRHGRLRPARRRPHCGRNATVSPSSSRSRRAAWPPHRSQRASAARIMTGAPLPRGRRHGGPGRAHRGARRQGLRDAGRRPWAATCAAPATTCAAATSCCLAAPCWGRPSSGCSPRSASRSSRSRAARGSPFSLPAASWCRRARPLGPGQIRNSNSFTAWGQALAAGAEPVLLGIAPDDRDETRRLIARALDEDVVITSGGVSVGDYDFVKQIEEELGVERRFWGVATKPGKPFAFGVRDGRARVRRCPATRWPPWSASSSTCGRRCSPCRVAATSGGRGSRPPPPSR